MIRPTRLDPQRAARHRRDGFWADVTLAEQVAATVAAHGDRTVIIDGRSHTYAELDAAADRLACALQRRGLAAGDVISFQLPNWWETAVVVLAAAKLGAVANPLQMIYRQSEIRFIVDQCASRVLIVPGEFRGRDHRAIAAEACRDLDAPPPIVVARGDGADGLDMLLAETGGDPLPQASADDVLLLMYTSGTTAAPKGVLHTHNTLLSAAADLVGLLRYRPDDRVLMPSPVTHVTGLLLGFLAPWSVGASCVLMDDWTADKAMDAVLEHGCTFTGGATTFIRGLVDVARDRGLRAADIPLERGPCGGADVPPSVIYDAAEVLGARFTRIYGATEGVTVTGTPLDAPLAGSAETDGTALPGYDVKVVGDDGRELPAGETGEVLVRGPSNFVGYFDAALNDEIFKADGFITLGDLGARDADGAIRIQGRKKDIIIRNGENVSVKEVEDLLAAHPAIADVAIVGVPDPQTGEKGFAYVVTRTGEELTLEAICTFLDELQIAKQKYPEYLACVDELPRTASGKVQKFRLREDARSRTASPVGTRGEG